MDTDTSEMTQLMKLELGCRGPRSRAPGVSVGKLKTETVRYRG